MLLTVQQLANKLLNLVVLGHGDKKVMVCSEYMMTEKWSVEEIANGEEVIDFWGEP
jgi:hypothetical protein